MQVGQSLRFSGSRVVEVLAPAGTCSVVVSVVADGATSFRIEPDDLPGHRVLAGRDFGDHRFGTVALAASKLQIKSIADTSVRVRYEREPCRTAGGMMLEFSQPLEAHTQVRIAVQTEGSFSLHMLCGVGGGGDVRTLGVRPLLLANGAAEEAAAVVMNSLATMGGVLAPLGIQLMWVSI